MRPSSSWATSSRPTLERAQLSGILLSCRYVYMYMYVCSSLRCDGPSTTVFFFFSPLFFIFNTQFPCQSSFSLKVLVIHFRQQLELFVERSKHQSWCTDFIMLCKFPLAGKDLLGHAERVQSIEWEYFRSSVTGRWVKLHCVVCLCSVSCMVFLQRHSVLCTTHLIHSQCRKNF